MEISHVLHPREPRTTMLKRLRQLLRCFFSGHEYSITSWTLHGIVSKCDCCDRVRYYDLPKPTDNPDA